MRVIEQNEPKHECDLMVDKSEDYIYIAQCDDILKISKQGAKQLIDVLKEFINDSNAS